MVLVVDDKIVISLWYLCSCRFGTLGAMDLPNETLTVLQYILK